MSDPREELVRQRYVTLIWVRALGVLAMVAGIVIWKSDLVVSGGAPKVGFPLFVTGFLASMAVPQILVRRWRTPPER